MDFAVVIPTYNERENIPLLISRLEKALHGRHWEAIFVDDDSPDGTAEVVASYAVRNPHIRLLHRIGRRGLSSACIEGLLSTQAPFLAVMDADLQHDETILPELFDRLRREPLDVVIATRNAEGGSMGNFGRVRVLLSQLGQKISTIVCQAHLTDPMSGFFALRRDFFLDVVHDVQGGGFKILVDLLSSSRQPVRLSEIGYTFAERQHGESKLDVVVGIEYLAMVINKLVDGILPVGLMLYLAVGGFGLITYFFASFLFIHLLHVTFLKAEIMATFAAMSENFYLNNRLTFRDIRLRGTLMLSGAINFLLICSFGAWANIVLSSTLLREGVRWPLAGLCGILLGSVWNLSISSQLTWRAGRKARAAAATARQVLLESSR